MRGNRIGKKHMISTLISIIDHFVSLLVVISPTIMSSHDGWFRFLVSVCIDGTLTHAIDFFPVCHDKKNYGLLHSHHHSSLLEKLTIFHPLVRDSMLSKIKMLVLRSIGHTNKAVY